MSRAPNLDTVAEMARDAGRLPWSPEADRLRRRVEDLDQWLFPTASEMYRHLLTSGVEDSAALFEALELAQQHYDKLQQTLYGKEVW